MGDERKVKWQFLEERERMEKYFQDGFQSYLYTLFRLVFHFPEAKLRINFSRFIFHLAEKTLFFSAGLFGKLRMTVYRRGESNVQTCAGYPIGY